ncbi:hypothetical protein FACS1894205_6810 [Alphaproteobacteria bacterium]|nr:hypothetical protein FACS1894205_6810 [Alphaproteobacteria bacterium]
MDAGRDGISLDVAQGTVMFGSGDACRSGCDVATLGGVAGIGGKDTDVARGSAMRGDGVMLAVTASERDRSSVVDVIAVGNGMQVAVTGTGLATQVLSQQSSVKLGGNAAAVSALDTQRLQGQMDKVTAVSTTSSSQVSGTSLMAAIDTGVNAKSLTSGLSSSSGSRVAVSQGLSGSAIKGVSGLANGITGGIANSGLKNQGSGIGIKENLTRNGSGTIGKSGGTIGKGSIVVKR